jgi:hypothetical protein
MSYCRYFGNVPKVVFIFFIFYFMKIEQNQVVGGFVTNETSPSSIALDPNGAVMITSNRLQKRHYTSGTITYYAEAPLGTPTTTAGWRVWRTDTATGSDIEFAIGSLGLPTDTFEFAATDALLALHNYGFIPDTTVPTLSTVTIASNNTDTTRAKVGDTVTLTIVSSENLRTPIITIAGRAATVVPGTNLKSWTATQVMATGDTSGTVAFSIAFADIGGTSGVTVTALTGGSGVSFDKTAPTMLSAVRDTDTSITVTLSELALESTITKANAGGFVVTEVGTATTYAVSAIAPGATNDLVVLTVASIAASDLLGVKVTYAAG